MHGLDAAFEIEKQVAVSATQFRPGMNSHGGFGDHPKSSLTADAKVVDVDTVRGLGHGARRQHARWGDHPQGDYHVLDLAVLVALHPSRPRGDPTAERGVQERVWKVAEGQAIPHQLLFKIGTKGAGLDARSR